MGKELLKTKVQTYKENVDIISTLLRYFVIKGTINSEMSNKLEACFYIEITSKRMLWKYFLKNDKE